MFEINQHLQYNVMALHNENEQMKDHLDYVVKGGDPKKLERRMVDGLFNEADDSQLFKTP